MRWRINVHALQAGNDLSEMIQVYNLLIQPEGSQCQAAMIGTSDKKALWVMSRQLTLEPVALQKMREHLNKCGISTFIISATKRGEPRTSWNHLKPVPSQHSAHPESLGLCRTEPGSGLWNHYRPISTTWLMSTLKRVTGEFMWGSSHSWESLPQGRENAPWRWPREIPQKWRPRKKYSYTMLYNAIQCYTVSLYAIHHQGLQCSKSAARLNQESSGNTIYKTIQNLGQTLGLFMNSQRPQQKWWAITRTIKNLYIPRLACLVLSLGLRDCFWLFLHLPPKDFNRFQPWTTLRNENYGVALPQSWTAEPPNRRTAHRCGLASLASAIQGYVASRLTKVHQEWLRSPTQAWMPSRS